MPRYATLDRNFDLRLMTESDLEVLTDLVYRDRPSQTRFSEAGRVKLFSKPPLRVEGIPWKTKT